MARVGAEELIVAADLEDEGVARRQVHRLVERGDLVRIDRGVFALPDFEPTEHHHLALVALRCPRAVIAMTSAAAFHRLGTQVPHTVWIALPPRTWAPKLESVRVEVARFSGSRLEEDVEEHLIEGARVRVYGLAKTVVDLFRYRNKLGLDVALEAMREALRDGRASVAELAQIARRDGVSGPIRPYLESMQ
ncbi:MAG: type IV toxin-antitoxin system AbiEi family antitoxin domain-containing protein [Dehalococcoidia bacterium]|nr:type IV toxin-antitoxin system AbiEi family antitoxin domain-containing protein [Dehalococcoidia bacterium]